MSSSYSIRGGLAALRRDIEVIQTTTYGSVLTSTVNAAKRRIELLGQERERQIRTGCNPKPIPLSAPLTTSEILFETKTKMMSEYYDLVTRVQHTIKKDIRDIIKKVSNEDADLLGHVAVELEQEVADIFIRAINRVQEETQIQLKKEGYTNESVQ